MWVRVREFVLNLSHSVLEPRRLVLIHQTLQLTNFLPLGFHGRASPACLFARALGKGKTEEVTRLLTGLPTASCDLVACNLYLLGSFWEVPNSSEGSCLCRATTSINAVCPLVNFRT